MPDPLIAYRERGWTVFEADAAMTEWARACEPVAARLMDDPAQDHWWRCGRTWFAGVNVLPNDGAGAVPEQGVPAVSGAAVSFVREALGCGDFDFDLAQISVVMPGYPAHGDEETEAAWRYRVKRCAAHVDGLERIMPGRRRKLSETHGFVLGIPLGEAGVDEGAFVVWDGSHEIMRTAFRDALADVPLQQWRAVDLTEAHTTARAHCFEVCEPVEIAPGLGGAYVVHPLALHGVAPWRGGEGPPRAVAYFRPDTLNSDPQRWLAA